MTRLSTLTLTMASLIGLSGCAIDGKWERASVEPTAAVRDFEMETLTLQKDGTFYAEKNESGIRTTSGSYTYEDGVLALTEHSGVIHTYDVELEGANRIHLRRFWKDQKVHAVFERKE